MTEEADELLKLSPIPEIAKSSYLQTNQGREGFIGWMGYGGSIMQWHPEHKIAIGYVPFDQFTPLDMCNVRAKRF